MVLAFALVLAAVPDAGSPVVLKLEREQPVLVTLKDLQDLGPVTVDWSEKGAAHRVTGVRLDRLLTRLGYDEGPTGPQAAPTQKHRGLRSVLVATAADGYQAVFSVGEVQEALGATTVLIVWEQDGRPVASTFGPLRLVVTSDKRSTRSIRQLVALRLVDVVKP